MSLQRNQVAKDIQFHLNDQSPVFEGRVPPELARYLMLLSSRGFSDDRIAYTLKQIKEKRL